MLVGEHNGVGVLCRIHVVFGRVIDGQDIVRMIEQQKVDENSRPLADVIIASCGELVLQVRPKGMISIHRTACPIK